MRIAGLRPSEGNKAGLNGLCNSTLLPLNCIINSKNLNVSVVILKAYICDNTEILLSLMKMENEDDYMTAEDEDITFCHVNQSKELLPINAHLQDSSRHVSKKCTFGNWELVQWFQFCRPKDTEDSELKGTNYNNNFINRKMESGVIVQHLLHLQNNLNTKENKTYLDVPIAPTSSAQEEQSLALPTHAWNVNTTFKWREKINFIQLSTPDELKASIKNKIGTLQDFSTYLNDCSSRCDLFDPINGIEQDDLFGYDNGCESIFSFSNKKSEFEDAICDVICEDLIKTVPSNYNLDTTEEFQVPAVCIPSFISEHYFQNEINKCNMVVKENRTPFCRALIGLNFPHVQTVMETDHTYCERQTRHKDPAKVRPNNKQFFDEKQNEQIPTNIVNPASTVSESWKFAPFTVGKRDVLGQRTHTVKISRPCSSSILTNTQISIQKKRKMQVEASNEEKHSVKRYRKCFTNASATMGMRKESININHTFEVFGENVSCSIAAECWSSFKRTESRLKHTGDTNKMSRKYNGEMFCIKNKGFSNIEHFLFPTLDVFPVMKHLSARFHNKDIPFYSKASSQEHFITYATTLEAVFSNKLSVCCSSEPVHLCIPLIGKNNTERLLMLLFKYVASEVFGTPCMSEKINEDMSCNSNFIQFGLLIHDHIYFIKSNLSILCDLHSSTKFAAKFLKKDEKTTDAVLKIFIVSCLNKHFILFVQLESEQDQCITSGKLKCHQISSVSFLCKYNDRKKRAVMNSEMYFSCKSSLKESNIFLGNYISMQNDICTVCSSSLFREIKFTNINVYETPIIHIEDITHLYKLCFIDKCIYFPASPIKYISAPNYLTFSAKCNAEKASNCGSLIAFMTGASQLHFEENTQKSSRHSIKKTCIPFYCKVWESDANQKNSSQNNLEVEVIEVSSNTANTHNTITVKKGERKNWGKSQITSICPNTCLFSILDTYQKIPLATTFDDQDIINFTCGSFKESIENGYVNANATNRAPNTNTYMTHLADLSVSSSHLSNDHNHNCAELINVSEISPNWMYPQKVNLNLALMSFDQKCTTESIKEPCADRQFLDGTEIHVKLNVHDHDSGTIANCVSDDVHCSVSICEHSAFSHRLSRRTLEPSEYVQIDAIKKSPITLPILKALDDTNCTLELEQEALVTKHISHTEDKQMKNRCCKDEFEPVELERTIDQKLYLNQTCFVKQTAYEKSILEQLAPEDMLSRTILPTSLTDMNMINAECSITFKELPPVDHTQITFKMKSQFDLVLKELAMFHEISKEQETKPSHEKTGSTHYQTEEYDLANHPKMDSLSGKHFLQNTLLPSTKCHKTKRHTITKSPSLCEGKVWARKEEQEVPNRRLYSSTTDEESMYQTTNEGGCFSHGIGRVLPLKTCIGPIRVGLSKKAKTKQLHPYLKQVY